MVCILQLLLKERCAVRLQLAASEVGASWRATTRRFCRPSPVADQSLDTLAHYSRDVM